MTEHQIQKIQARLLPLEEVQSRLALGRSTVFGLLETGQLRSVKVGKRRLVSEAALTDFIEALDDSEAV